MSIERGGVFPESYASFEELFAQNSLYACIFRLYARHVVADLFFIHGGNSYDDMVYQMRKTCKNSANDFEFSIFALT